MIKVKKLTEEHKRKIGEARKGKPFSGISWSWLGKKFTKEHKAKLSLAKKGKPQLNRRGSNCHFWKGGVTPQNMKIRKSIEHRLWSEAVFARDNWTCQKCDEQGGTINSHHIFNFASHIKLRFAIDNGVTLCKKCHGKFHRKYGLKNNNKTQLKEFIGEVAK